MEDALYDTLQHTQGFDLVALQMPQGWELIIILGLVFLLFGAKKMPDAARGIGKSLRILKTETKGLRDGDDDGTPSVSESSPAQITTDTVPADGSADGTSSQTSSADVSDAKEPAHPKTASKE